MLKVAAVLVPMALVVASAIFAEAVLFKAIADPRWRGFTMALGGLLVALLIGAANNWFARRIGIESFRLGTPMGLAWGFGSGLILSLAAAVCFYFANRLTTLDFQALWVSPARLLGNIFPAVTEEMGFRGGAVQALSMMLGEKVGLLGGSVPFGVAHLAGKLFGRPVDLMYVLGCTMAGLVLGLIYLRCGLFHAMAFHWVWNVLCRTWMDVFKLNPQSGVMRLEGAWTTSLLLVLVFAFYWRLPGSSS